MTDVRTEERNGELVTTNKVHFTLTTAERYPVAAVMCALRLVLGKISIM